MQNVAHSSAASADEKRKREGGSESLRGKLPGCQERGICDRSRAVPNAEKVKARRAPASCLLTLVVFAAGTSAAETQTVSPVRDCGPG